MEFANPEDKQYVDITKKPKFLRDAIKLTKAEIGTATHLILQNLDLKLNYDEGQLKLLIDNMVQKEIIARQEAEAISINEILKFTKTELYSRIQKAKKVFKEQPFYLSIPVKELHGIDVNESILVQGVIDLYFIDENDNIVLVDYKTNYVENDKEEELVKRYEKQLDIYKRAIEEVANKPVKEAYIYSTHLSKEILFT